MVVFLVNPWKNMSKEEKIKELLNAGVREDVIIDQEVVKRLKRYEKIKKVYYTLIIIAFISTIGAGILTSFNASYVIIAILSWIALIVVISMIGIVVWIPKKSNKPLVKRLEET